MIYQIYKDAKSNNINQIVIEAIKTEKNIPILDFLTKNPYLESTGGNNYLINTEKVNINMPEYISIIGDI